MEDVPSGRRLLVFAALFLGMLALSQANFSRPVPLIAPPALALMVLLMAAAGLMIWVDPSWSRVLLWWGVGVALLTSGMTALLEQPPTWLAIILIMLSVGGLLGSVVATIPKWRPTELAAPGRWMAIFSGLLLLLVARAGAGPILALVVAAAGLIFIWLLRPVVE